MLSCLCNGAQRACLCCTGSIIHCCTVHRHFVYQVQCWRIIFCLQATSRFCCLRTVTTFVSCVCTPATIICLSTDRRASLRSTTISARNFSSGRMLPRNESACKFGNGPTLGSSGLKIEQLLLYLLLHIKFHSNRACSARLDAVYCQNVEVSQVRRSDFAATLFKLEPDCMKRIQMMVALWWRWWWWLWWLW